MKPTLRRLLHVVGGGVAVVGVVFVALQLVGSWDQLAATRLDATTWLLVGLLAAGYGMASVMLGVAWWNALLHVDIQSGRGWAIRVYGLSQIAKYVPGNILHLAGRQALGMAAGLPAGALTRSMAWELGVIVFAGSLFALLTAPLVVPGWPPWASIILFAGTAGALMVSLRLLVSRPVAAVVGWQVLFLAASGASFAALAVAVSPADWQPHLLPALAGAYVVAWLAGLVMPGAPAGVGVRELVLLFLLGAHGSQADLVITVILARLVTVAGDLLYFVAATRMPARRLRNG
jgi:glycosyltransferase 2 family protein